MAKQLANHLSVSIIISSFLWNEVHAIGPVGDLDYPSYPAATVRTGIITEVEEESPDLNWYASYCKIAGCIFALPFSLPATKAIYYYTFDPLGVPRSGLGEAGAVLCTMAITGYAFGKVGWKIGDSIYHSWFAPMTQGSS